MTRRGIYVGTEVLEIPSPSWIIQDLLPEQSLDVLYGPPKSGKTFVALDMALHIANGLSWNGHETPLGGGVLYVLAEGIGGVGKRIDAWLRHNNLQGQEQRILSKFVIQTVPLNLLRMSDAMTLFKGIVLDSIKPRLVVFDTLARNMVGADENSSRDMGIVIASLDAVRNQLSPNNGSVKVLHHSGKDGKLGPRGSSALAGAADVSARVTRSGKGLLTLEYEFMKEWDLPDPMTLRMVPVGQSLALESADRLALPVGGSTDKRTAKATSILILLKRENRTMGINEIRSTVGGDKGMVSGLVDFLEARGAVVVTPGPNRSKQVTYLHDLDDGLQSSLYDG